MGIDGITDIRFVNEDICSYLSQQTIVCSPRRALDNHLKRDGGEQAMRLKQNFKSAQNRYR